MAKNSKSVAETVWALAEPIADELGCWIWDVEFLKEGARRVLRITVDSEEGVNIDDCEKMHRAIDPLLDEADPIEEQYYLEVSSPGLERELRTEEHYRLSIGSAVEAKLFAAKDGTKSVVGKLTAYEDGKLTITNDLGDITLEKSEVSKLTTVFFEDKT